MALRVWLTGIHDGGFGAVWGERRLRPVSLQYRAYRQVWLRRTQEFGIDQMHSSEAEDNSPMRKFAAHLKLATQILYSIDLRMPA